MNQVFQYEIPVWHPLLVHFPIVLVLVVSILMLLWLFRDRVGLLVTGTWIQFAAVIMTTSAYLTGEEMEERSEGVPIVDQLVEMHEDAALLSIWLSCLALLAMLFAIFVHRKGYLIAESDSDIHIGSPVWIRLVVLVFVFATLVAVWWTAHIGGTMVWGTAR